MKRCAGLESRASATIVMTTRLGCTKRASASHAGEINLALMIKNAEATPMASAYARPRLMNSRRSIKR
jgi:hypothetical protein